MKTKAIYMILSLVCALLSIYAFLFYGFEKGYPLLVLSLLCRIVSKLEKWYE